MPARRRRACEPISALAASSTSSTVGATAPRPTRAAVTVPSLIVRLTPTPTTAMSISVRGIMRRYASLDPGGRGGSVKLTRISPGFRLVRPGPAGTSSTLISRRPFGPCTVTTAPAATIAGTLSPAGEPLQRLPPAEARPCTCLEPIRLIASSTPGQTLPKRLVIMQRHAGDGGADAEAAIGGLLDFASSRGFS